MGVGLGEVRKIAGVVSSVLVFLSRNGRTSPSRTLSHTEYRKRERKSRVKDKKRGRLFRRTYVKFMEAIQGMEGNKEREGPKGTKREIG